MRLLNTSTLQLTEFVSETPLYAILSHVWGDDEVLFSHVQDGTASAHKGYAKLKSFCDKAREDGFTWVWDDTCCIDKSSSAELSEAINSMFRWYASATLCYAYLSDVHDDGQGDQGGQQDSIQDQFIKSRWFSRGWTLQELLAPRYVEFYTAEWVEIGTKDTCCEQLRVATNIPEKALLGDISTIHDYYSVAARMSWAARRETSRPEDVAYSLLGLFDIHMPLLYGEGDTNAFLRLQEAILHRHNDYSIFAWSTLTETGSYSWGDTEPVLAHSPSRFSTAVLFEAAGEDTVMNFLPPRGDLEEDLYWPIEKSLLSRRIDCSDIFSYRTTGRLAIELFGNTQQPQFGALGLRLSLPVLRLSESHPNDNFLGWVATMADGRLLCISIGYKRRNNGQRLIRRINCGGLLALPAHMARSFVVEDLLTATTHSHSVLRPEFCSFPGIFRIDIRAGKHLHRVPMPPSRLHLHSTAYEMTMKNPTSRPISKYTHYGDAIFQHEGITEVVKNDKAACVLALFVAETARHYCTLIELNQGKTYTTGPLITDDLRVKYKAMMLDKNTSKQFKDRARLPVTGMPGFEYYASIRPGVPSDGEIGVMVCVSLRPCGNNRLTGKEEGETRQKRERDQTEALVDTKLA